MVGAQANGETCPDKGGAVAADEGVKHTGCGWQGNNHGNESKCQVMGAKAVTVSYEAATVAFDKQRC